MLTGPVGSYPLSRSEEFRPDACDSLDQTYPRRVAHECPDRSTLRDYAEGAHWDTKRAPNVTASMTGFPGQQQVDNTRTRALAP